MKSKVLLFLLLAIIVLIPSKVFGLNVNNFEIVPNDKLYYDSIDRKALIEKFGIEYKKVLEKNSYELSIGRIVDNYLKNNYNGLYPNYFGGMYISDDSNSLILQIVKKYIPEYDNDEYMIYKNLISMDNTIKIEYVNYSYNELNALNNSIMDEYSIDDNYISNYIDVKNNSIIINMNDINSKNSINIKNNHYDNMYNIKYGIFDDFSTLKAGSKINIGSGEYCSMGFRTKYKGNKGYVTAGHCTKGVGTSISTGTVKLRSISGKVDFSFVKTKSSYSLSNSLAYPGGGVSSIYSTNYCPLIIVGTIIGKSGVYSGYSYGTITSVNYSGKDKNGHKYTNLVSANAYSGPGDSGGPVYNKSSGLLYGIITGGNPYDANESLIFSNINNFPSSIINGLY